MGSSSTSPFLRFLNILALLVVLQLISPSSASRPRALVVPVSKDAATKQYVARISQRTPLVPLPLVVNLGDRFLWVECSPTSYISTTYRPARCGSAQCALAIDHGCGSPCFSLPSPGCNNNTCDLITINTFSNTIERGKVASDVLSLSSTDGSNPGPAVSVPNFVFSCAPPSLLQGLANRAKGMAALGRAKVSLPSQLAAHFSFPRKFAICLSSSHGVIFFGEGRRYSLLPNVDASHSLTYTRLLVNPISTAGAYRSSGEKSADYFIGVMGIRVSEKAVALNATLLGIDRNGVGGTKLSTAMPYTVMEMSIYKAVIKAFATALSGVKRVKAVAPFELCYGSKGIRSTRVGPAVPTVDFVMEDGVYWRMFGANSMVEARENVLCLGFVDGGVGLRTSIEIGGYQLEDNLLEFDLAKSRLGFSSSLLFRQTTCGNFNFTSNA